MMPDSPKKKKKFFKLKLLFSLLIIMGFVLLVIYFNLPFIIESIIVPKIAPILGIQNYSLNIDKADIDGLSVSSIKIFGKEKTGIKIDSFKIQIKDAEVQSLDVDGLVLNFDFKNGNLIIPGIKPRSKNKSQNPDDEDLIPSILSPDFTVSVVNSELSLNLEINGKENNIKVPFEIELERKNDNIHFYSKAKGLEYKDDKFDLHMPECELSGIIALDKNILKVNGIAKFANISFKTGKLEIPEIGGNLPFEFHITGDGVDFDVPNSQDRKKGLIEIPEILFGKKSFGKMSVSILQEKGSFILKGEHSGLIKDQKTYFDGKVTVPSSEKQLSAELKISFEGKDLNLKLDEFHPKVGAVHFMGNFNALVEASWKNNIINSKAEIKISEGIFEDKIRNFAISNIALDFKLDDLLKLKSKPSQTLSFGSLKFNNFLLDNGKISFQTESLKKYLIETSEFKWCGGHVDSNAFRINAESPGDIDIALYCDRLNVAQVLNQFQLGKASGKGTVSGKIPLIYKNRKINIDDGFLYSTPGIGGNISLTDFLGPLANLPSGFQMDIAKEALKDFDYEWLRLRINSEKEDLLIQLEMEGKPADLLPFGYDLKRGGLYKSDDPEQKARFRGISFQINFRLPANQMLKYGRKFKEISGKF